MNNATRLFLSQSQDESRILYNIAVDGKHAAFWDNVAVTAATDAQAEIYQALIDDRLAQGYLPRRCRYHAEPDRGEARIGSGGATICMMAKLLNDCGGDIERLIAQKNLILHSGGEAKRLPHSAPFGKLFALSGAHIGSDLRNPPGTVFDDLMVSLAGLPSRMHGGIVIVSADAFFRFNHTQFDLDTPDAAALAMKADISEGIVHGVFLEKSGGIVSRFLHKLPEDELRRAGAVSDAGTVDLDIGITYLGVNAIKAVLSLVLDDSGKVDDRRLSAYANDRARLSFYGDIIYPMAADSTMDKYLAQAADGNLTPELLELRPGIFDALRKITLKIVRLVPGMIRNMGTTGEAFDTLRFFREEANFGYANLYDENIALNSGISEKADIGDNCFIEHSAIYEKAQLGSNCLISNCELPSGFEVPDGIALHCVRLHNRRWVCRVWGVSDDIKSNQAWFGKPLQEWDPEADSLWDAKLYPACDSRQEALEWARAFFARTMNDELMQKWRACDRLSLSDTGDIDLGGMLKDRAACEDRFRIDAFADKALSGTPIDEVIGYLGLGSNAARRINMMHSLLDDGHYERWQDEMRLYMCIGEAAELLELDCCGDVLRSKGFETLRNASARFSPTLSVERQGWACDSVEVALPIRVNMGGTWSDAPPYCYEHGGTMLNAAACLDGELPIHVCAERLREPVVELISIDLTTKKRYDTLEPLLDYHNPADPFILFKAALSMSGILAEAGGSLKEQLERVGGGVRIISKVDVPKGSGLGTSSILTGAIIDALSRLAGRERSSAELSDDVLLAEQLMTTGGGWQDVIGGMYAGIKLTFTKPGIPQKYDVQTLALPNASVDEMNKRGFLMYTGQRRLARSVLRRVVTNYVCNRRDSLAAFEETRRLAVVMAHELRRGNISGFGKLLSEHMRLLRLLDASSSNLMLDHIMDGLNDLTDGTTLCGAAGGGFLYGISKADVTHDDIRAWIECEHEGTAIKLYTCEIVG